MARALHRGAFFPRYYRLLILGSVAGGRYFGSSRQMMDWERPGVNAEVDNGKGAGVEGRWWVGCGRVAESDSL